MANAFLETTQWNGDVKNHVYFLDGDLALAYIPEGESKAYYFKKPIQIDRRQRTFVKVSSTAFTQVEPTKLREVKGSKGDIYYVDDERKTCTCAGFRFRGKCPHIVT